MFFAKFKVRPFKSIVLQTEVQHETISTSHGPSNRQVWCPLPTFLTLLKPTSLSCLNVSFYIFERSSTFQTRLVSISILKTLFQVDLNDGKYQHMVALNPFHLVA